MTLVPSFKKLPNARFLQVMREAEEVPWTTYDERKFLERRTVRALCVEIFGAYECYSCGASPRDLNHVLEGHHVKSSKMYVSDYHHAMKRNERRMNIANLGRELTDNIRMVCKACHETVHHREDRFVKQAKHLRLCQSNRSMP